MRNIVRIIFIVLLFSEPVLANSSQLRIMPLGNSITRGKLPNKDNKNTDIGYRKRLYNSLKGIYTGIGLDFVGSLSNGDDGLEDKNHEGHSGWSANQIRDNVKTWLTNNPADVVLLHIGTNDFGTQPLADIVNEVAEILDNIDQYETDNGTEVIVFVARIVRFLFDGFSGTTDFNNQIATMVNQRTGNGDKLVLVDQESTISYPGGLPDLIHPDQNGYNNMADVWRQAITSHLAAPQIIDPGAQTANVGENFQYQIVAEGVPTPVISTDNLPVGMTYDAGTQTVSWTPDAGQAGGASFDITAENALGENNLNVIVNVNAGDDDNPPTAMSETVTINEDEDHTFTENDFNFNDIDGDTFNGIQITSEPANGSLIYDGAPVDIMVDDIMEDVGLLVFDPGTNENGAGYASFGFRVRASNNEFSVDTYTMTIDVTALNDAPVFTAGGNQTIDENAGPQLVAWASNIDDGDPELDQGLEFIVGNNNGALFATEPSIDDNGILTYETAANINGSATVTVRLQDEGDGTPPNVNSSGTVNFTITVNPLNSKPSFTAGGNQTVNEDAGPQSVAWATNISDGDPELSQDLTFIVNNDNSDLFDTEPAIDDVGTLTYETAANANGIANVTVRLQDNGSNDGQNENSSDTENFTITVNAINDPPSFTKGADQIVAEDAGPQTVNNWATDLDDGDPDATQTLFFDITNNTNELLFAVQPVVNPMGGTLTYETAANATGTATITVRIRDSGDGTAPNVNIGNSETFDITVTPVNDPPQVNNSNGNTQYLESSGTPFVVIDGAVTVTDPDNSNLTSGRVAFTGTYIENEDILNFIQAGTGINGTFDKINGVMELTGNRPVSEYQTVFSSMQYFNGAGANPTGGDRVLTFSVSDGDLTGMDTKILTVVTENSAPFLVSGDIDDVTVNEDAPDFAIELFDEFDDNEDPDTDLVFAVDNNTNLGLFTSTDIDPATGILTLDFAPNAFGSADLTVSATDTDMASTSSTFTVTVNGVNDPPTTSGIANVNVNEDAPNTVINLFNAFDDLEDADAALIYTVEQNTNPGLFSNVTINNPGGTLTLDYNTNANGVSSLTIRATDTGGLDVDASFTVSVAAINDEPSLDNIPDPAPILEDAGQQVINLTGIGAGPNESQLLTVTATTDNDGLLSIAPVEYTSPATTGIVRYTPIANASGSADIEVCVTDSGESTPPHDNQICRTFTVVVNPVNDNPTIDPIADPGTIFVNAGEQCVPISGISAGPGENQPITVVATSSNTALIPNTPSLPVNYTSPDATGEVCYTPLPDQFGQSIITVNVQDGVAGGIRVETFTVVVSPVNQQPTIDQVTDIVLDEDATPGPLTLTGISAGPGESQDLDIVLISDNTDLFDPEGESLSINYVQGSNEATLLYTPEANVSGEANITIRLTDNGPGTPPNDNQNEMTFKITVNSINDAPALDEIPDQGIFDIGEEPSPVNLTGISEGPEEDQTINITFSSDNGTLVDPAKILVDFDPANDFGTLTYVIEPGLEGEANITVCVNDGGSDIPPNVNTFCRTFKVTVSGASDLEITNATLSINEVSRGQIFTVNSSIRNNGNESVESTFLNYYISGDDIFDDGSDDLLGIVPIGPIGSGGTENVWPSVELKVSETTPAATYFIIVVVDKTNNIPELNEDNNVFAVQIVVNSNRFPEIEYNNAPPLLLADDQFINYRAVVTDDELQTANPVRFFYRGISSDKEFTEKNAEEIEESLFQFTLEREEFLKDAIGIEYYFDVKDIGNLVTQTEVAYTYEQYAEPGLTFDNLKYGSGSGDYQMVSVPLELDKDKPNDVFADADDFGPYNKEKWRLFRFQGSGVVENEAGLENMPPGNAYWLIVREEPDTPVDTGPGITTQVTKQAPYVISLSQGWNQIGSPYNFDVSWSDVISFNNDPAGVNTVLREYQGGWEESDVLRAFGGAFVESTVDIEIQIPVTKNNAIQTGRLAGSNGSAANQEGEWEVRIDLLTPEFNSKINGFGMKRDASYSNDRYDASSSPNLDFLNNLELKFDHPEYFQKSFTKDIRPVAASEIWEFTIDSEASGFTTMEWGDISEQIGSNELYLYDVGKGVVIDMLNTTSYEVNLASSRVFKAYYGTKAFIDENLKPEIIHLGQSYPNPFTNFTHIPFTLAKNQSSYQLELSVFNLMGQKVKDLATGEFQPGFYELEWNGKNEKGDTQPSGIYLYKLVVELPGGNNQTQYGRAILR